MSSVTLNVSDNFKGELKLFSWINWSDVAREEVLKKQIFENYMKAKKLEKWEAEFCDSIDWHPVDELPLKKEFVKKLENARKEKSYKPMTVDNLFE
jgi:hypothetical protein